MSAGLGEPATESWRLYVFDTDLDCALGCGHGSHDLYDGLSDEPLRRVLEHAKTKGWWPYVTGWRQLPEEYATEADARAAEKALIRGRLPLANEQHNMDNPHRLVFPKLPARRPASGRAARRRRRWTPRRQRLAGVGSVWLALLGLGWWAAAALGLSVLMASLDGAVAASAVMLAAWVQTRPKRGRRAFGRHLGGWAVAAAVVYELWSIGSVLSATAGVPH